MLHQYDIYVKNKKEIKIEENNNLPVEVKKEKFFDKTIKFFKNIF